MAEPVEVQFTLQWDDHLPSISKGLCALQQNEEFVDMTIAADGHFVKVHQVVMALASPFIKEIITSMKCEHPVIFLNKVTYSTLSSILEYVYTGEVNVSSEEIREFIKAAKNLHIKGLQDVDVNYVKPEIHIRGTQFTNSEDNEEEYFSLNEKTPKPACEIKDLQISDLPEDSVINYTVSNRGSLQMILNKYMYYLKHTNKDSSRQWRCVDYLNENKCPALIFTRNDFAVQRLSVHNHPHHEKKILKRFESGNVYSAFQEAEERGCQKRVRKNNAINDDD